MVLLFTCVYCSSITLKATISPWRASQATQTLISQVNNYLSTMHALVKSLYRNANMFCLLNSLFFMHLHTAVLYSVLLKLGHRLWVNFSLTSELHLSLYTKSYLQLSHRLCSHKQHVTWIATELGPFPHSQHCQIHIFSRTVRLHVLHWTLLPDSKEVSAIRRKVLVEVLILEAISEAPLSVVLISEASILQDSRAINSQKQHMLPFSRHSWHSLLITVRN